MSNIKDFIKKYEAYISNIEWHIKTNKPPEDEIKKLNYRIDHYSEILSDLKSIQNKAALQNKVSDVSVDGKWEVFSHTSALGMTGDYMSDCGISNDAISFYCDKPDDITNEELQEICDKLNTSIVNERKDNAGSDAIEFLDSIRDYERENGERICNDERDSEELYKMFRQLQPQQKEVDEEKELEERTDRNMNVISDFVEHLESENIVIPESVILSFFNA
jgi:hypothetical protein